MELIFICIPLQRTAIRSRLKLLTKWNRMIVRLQIEHEISARDFEKFSWKLGIP
ncbi:hypothetical protein PGR6_18540 [Pseudomonas sp. GR 6-02]|nr:hypothetical protein PGR6_18540 [Pseudomonas sp. GR 6-02]